MIEAVIQEWDLEVVSVTREEGHMADTVAGALYEALITASKMVDRFRKDAGREMTEDDRAIGITLFLQEHGKSNGHGPAGNGAPRPQQAPQAGDVPPCPKCGGKMFDNRGSKKNPKAPDFRCKDTDCTDENGFRSGLWERDMNKQPARTSAPQRSPFDADDDDLGF